MIELIVKNTAVVPRETVFGGEVWLRKGYNFLVAQHFSLVLATLNFSCDERVDQGSRRTLHHRLPMYKGTLHVHAVYYAQCDEGDE